MEQLIEKEVMKMVQISNFHIGTAETATKPEISIMEASLLWDLLIARYRCVEKTQLYLDQAHDVEFRKILNYGLNILESQVNKLEEQMDKYKIPLPERPPKSINSENSTVINTDKYLFQEVFNG